MTEEIDARGLACPRPVIMTQKAIDDGIDCVVVVDNEVARDNVCRMAKSKGFEVCVEEIEDVFRIRVARGSREKIEETRPSPIGPTLVVFSSDRMGHGDDDLGKILIRSFLHTLDDISQRPDIVICFNSGVRIATEGSDVLEDLISLEVKGVSILVCGTCLDFFGLKGKLRAGIISNMYDIAEIMLSAGRVVRI